MSRLYKVLNDGGLKLVHEVATKGAAGATHFESTGLHYVVIANSVDNNQVTLSLINRGLDRCYIENLISDV